MLANTIGILLVLLYFLLWQNLHKLDSRRLENITPYKLTIYFPQFHIVHTQGIHNLYKAFTISVKDVDNISKIKLK